MTLQSFLKTLKTTKRTYPSSIHNLLICSSSTTQCPTSPEKPISDLTLSTLRRIVSDPDIKSSKRVSFFRFILENPSLFSFRPDLRTHLSLSLRVLSERKFSVARELLNPDVLRYPFRDIASGALDDCGGFEKKVVARLFNSMITVYSDSGRYDEVVEVFECMRSRSMKRL
uniref:Pentatricopeptide repeat-containing protein n=1 Tax=Brassica campestris TaxID=3711 RepID=A0A3P6BDA5_BRACM|nr:unnamed protein product [Brassica rapa]